MPESFEELRTLIRGEVLTDGPSLAHYAEDGSIFRVTPSAVVLPKDAADIAVVVRWAREKKEQDPANPAFSITARGKGTDQAGGPLNEGIIVRFPGYLDKMLEIGSDFVRVEPGALIGDINTALEPHGRFLPFYPASQAFSTAGGAVANNASGDKTLKYGSTRLYLKALKIVLSSGAEVVVTPLSYGDLALKKQQPNFEGEIYRNVAELLKKEEKVIAETRPKVNKYSIGYNLWEVLRDTAEGRVFDLTQLIAGSQGTLGILTEVTFWTLPKPKYSGLLLAFFDSLPKAGEATARLVKLGPSALEMVDHFVLELFRKEKPDALGGLVGSVMPEIVLLCEFEGSDADAIGEKLANAAAAVEGLAFETKTTADPEETSRFWTIRRQALPVMEHLPGKKKALPFIEDVTVPPERFPEYVSTLYEILKKHGAAFVVWGHAGNGNIHVQPLLDVGDAGDRERLFAITDEAFDLVVKLGGVFSGEHNDGIMRTPYLSRLYPPELLEAWREAKNIFDPLNIFNPGKKFGIDLEYAKAHLRDEYDVGSPPKREKKTTE